MNPFSAREIRGIWATLLLPVNDDDSIDYGLLATELDFLIAARVNGIYSNGTAAEFYSQTEGEFDRINGLMAERCERAGTPFQIGLCQTSAQRTRERLQRARGLNPAAVQVTLPDWFPPAMPEILAFLETMAADAAPIPLVVYNPPHAKRRIAPAEWLEIAGRIPGIAGVKVAGGNSVWYSAMQPVFARLSVFIAGHRLAEGLTRGARGSYSNVACLSPAGAQHWYELCSRDLPAGRRLGTRVAGFWQAVIEPLVSCYGFSNMAADKAAAVAGAWLPGLTPRLRWPYRSVPREHAAQIGAQARERLPELFP